jgi:hypothetical protein
MVRRPAKLGASFPVVGSCQGAIRE